MLKNHKLNFIVNGIFLALIIVFDICYMTVDCSSYVFKPLTSALFVLCGLFNLNYCIKTNLFKNKWFMILLFVGLVFAMLGDILLIDYFIVGAILFAIGHVFFFASFVALEGFNWLDLVLGGLIFGIALLLIELYPNFEFGEGMKIVVVLYALIISFMLGKALSNLIAKKNLKLDLLIFAGALLFFLSDLMLLFNVFASAPRVFDILCLSFYYPAEFLLAFSIAFAGMYFEKKLQSNPNA